MERRFMAHHPVVVDVGCGCRRSKLSTLFSVSSSFSSLKQRISKSPGSSTPSDKTSTSHEESSRATTISSFSSPFEDSSSPPSVKQAASGQKGEKQSPAVKRRNRKKKRKGVVVEESVAVVKESSNPYLDFRESMLVMIVEKEMYGRDDLCDLLHRFLSLNSPGYHLIILRAFTDILNIIFLPDAEVAGVSTAAVVP